MARGRASLAAFAPSLPLGVPCPLVLPPRMLKHHRVGDLRVATERDAWQFPPVSMRPAGPANVGSGQGRRSCQQSLVYRTRRVRRRPLSDFMPGIVPAQVALTPQVVLDYLPAGGRSPLLSKSMPSDSYHDCPFARLFQAFRHVEEGKGCNYRRVSYSTRSADTFRFVTEDPSRCTGYVCCAVVAVEP